MAHWTALDLRSMRSLQSQSRSQQRILNSQASLRQRVLASNQASNVVSGQAKAPPENEVDVLARLSEEELCNLVKSPPALEAGDEQAKLNLLSMDRTPLRSTVSCPEWVLVHIYNLSETFVGANQVLTFSEGLAIGGAFHVGVEVYGAEWSYGVYGVACDPPRSETAHVYECSVFVGSTAKDQEQAAQVLFRLCQEWHGRNYDVLSHNCCSFGRRFVEELGVGPMPFWIDRFARTLHGGRDAVRRGLQELGDGADYAGKRIHRFAMEDMPTMVEVARPHVERYVSDASAFAEQKRKQASQKLHQVVMHDVPAMIETARPHVEQAASDMHKAAQQKAQEGYEAVQKVVAEDAPKAMAAAQPYVEHAMNTAMYHTSNAMSSAQEAMQIAAEALHQQLFGEEEESSSEDGASPEAREAEAQRPTESDPEILKASTAEAVQLGFANRQWPNAHPMAQSPAAFGCAQAMATPVQSLPRQDQLADATLPYRASSMQGSKEAVHLGFANRQWPNASNPQMLQSPAAPVAQVVAAAPITSQPRRFISAASHEDVRLLVPSRVPSSDLATVRQNQVQWPARMHSATPRPTQQVSWMPPLPRPPGLMPATPAMPVTPAMPAMPAAAWSRPG